MLRSFLRQQCAGPNTAQHNSFSLLLARARGSLTSICGTRHLCNNRHLELGDEKAPKEGSLL